MSTLTEPKWHWYVGHYEEEYTSGPYETRAEAVQIAKEEYESGWIIEAYKRPISLAAYFDAGEFLERAEELGYDFSNENGDPLFDVDMDQMKDLQQRVRSTIKQWQADHKLEFIPWTFTGQRNMEFIDGEMGDS